MHGGTQRGKRKNKKERTLTLKVFGSLKTVRIVSACACISTSNSWISPGSIVESPFDDAGCFSAVSDSFNIVDSGCSAIAALIAAWEACRAGPGREDEEAMLVNDE